MFEPVNVKIEGGFDIAFPKMVPVRQIFNAPKLKNIEEAMSQEINREEIKKKIKPGQRIGVTVGSRGIANLKEIVFHTVSLIKKMGGKPFIIPAMGSHAGATAEGQAKLLEGYGISSETMGVPILSSMETVQVGTTGSGAPVFVDKNAFEADGVVVLNRVKPHTDFKGPFESGLMKMIVIGMGKHKGATYIHSQGFDQFAKLIPEAGEVILENLNILFGVAILENAYDETARLEAVPAEQFISREPELLEEAKSYMAKIIPREFDVLIVEEIGKDISGHGMDPNIVGRPSSGLPGFDGPKYQKSVVLDLTEKTKGNSTGLGVADVTTRTLVNKIDFSYSYANSITATVLAGAKIPVTMNNDKEAIAVALKTCNRIEIEKARIVIIKNTLELNKILVSEPLVEDLQQIENIEILGKAEPICFDETGRLLTKPSLI